MGLEQVVDYEVETKEVAREVWFCDQCGSEDTEEQYVVFGGTIDEFGDVAVEGGEDRCHICFTLGELQDHHRRLLDGEPKGRSTDSRAIESEQSRSRESGMSHEQAAKWLITFTVVMFILLIIVVVLI